MFRNLNAEQARNGLTNKDVAEILGISRVAFENKKKTGKFTILEAQKLCEFFHCDVDYLFKVYDFTTVKS